MGCWGISRGWVGEGFLTERIACLRLLAVYHIPAVSDSPVRLSGSAVAFLLPGTVGSQSGVCIDGVFRGLYRGIVGGKGNE